MAQTIQPEQLLCEKDIARVLNVSLATIRRQRAARAGVPFLRVGGSIRYAPEALRKYLGDVRR